MNQAVQISRFGGPQVLELIEVPTQPLRLNSVRIQVTAAGVNFADLMMRMGMYPEAPKPPFIPGYEIAGRVIEVGEAVRSLRPGDRVLAGTRFGGYASEVVLNESQVRKIPNHLSDIDAAAIPVNFLTAWIALMEMARVRKGDRVLIQSAAGGVGTAALQIAAHVGAHCVGVVSSSEKGDVLKKLGAAEIITQSDWENADDSDRGGFQIILDSTGGESLKRSFQRLSPTGRVINFGISGAVSGQKRSLLSLVSLMVNTSFFTPFKLMMENKGVFGLNLLQLFDDPNDSLHSEAQHKTSYNPLQNSLNQILERFEDKTFHPIVGKTFPLAQAGAAHTHLQSRTNIGKVVLIPSSTHTN